jgi:hypothetical protein
VSETLAAKYRKATARIAELEGLLDTLREWFGPNPKTGERMSDEEVVACAIVASHPALRKTDE